MDTVTWASVRSQMADAARETGQLEASGQEVAKQVEGASGRLGGACRRSGRDLWTNSDCWFSQRENEFLSCYGAFSVLLGRGKRCVVGIGLMQARLPNH